MKREAILRRPIRTFTSKEILRNDLKWSTGKGREVHYRGRSLLFLTLSADEQTKEKNQILLFQFPHLIFTLNELRNCTPDL